MIEYRPEFLHGYPSAVDVLAEYVVRHGLTPKLPPIKAALLGSETCSPAQRERIEAAFRTRVYTWYGHSERTVLGGECEYSRVYHMFPSYGILAIIGEDGLREQGGDGSPSPRRCAGSNGPQDGSAMVGGPMDQTVGEQEGRRAT